jgi:serine/threonine protein kinase
MTETWTKTEKAPKIQALDLEIEFYLFGRCDQGDLHKLIQEEKRKFSITQKTQIAADVASGLSYIHSLSIIHRDLRCAEYVDFVDTQYFCNFGF